MRNCQCVVDVEPRDASLRETTVKFEMEYKSRQSVVLLRQVSTIINGRLFEVYCEDLQALRMEIYNGLSIRPFEFTNLLTEVL